MPELRSATLPVRPSVRPSPPLLPSDLQKEPRLIDPSLLPAASPSTQEAHTHMLSTFHAPAARVGSASATLSSKIYYFSGRGGVEMAPLAPSSSSSSAGGGGGFDVFDPTTASWSEVHAGSGDAPEARSYHASCSDGQGVLYVHAGCPAKGRLRDLWCFDVGAGSDSRGWRKLAEAPGPARGGASVCWCKGKVWRMNGFDGETEQGGCLDVYSPEEDEWETMGYAADGKEGPEPRSVGCLVPVQVGGKDLLVTMFGEGRPSDLGHAGAGKMWGDVWAYDLERRKWLCVEIEGEAPRPRGWFDADAVEGGKVFVTGGLGDGNESGEGNERLDDAWILELK